MASRLHVAVQHVRHELLAPTWTSPPPRLALHRVSRNPLVCFREGEELCAVLHFERFREWPAKEGGSKLAVAVAAGNGGRCRCIRRLFLFFVLNC